MNDRPPFQLRQGMIAGWSVGTIGVVVSAIRLQLSTLEIVATASAVAVVLLTLYVIISAINRRRGPR